MLHQLSNKIINTHINSVHFLQVWSCTKMITCQILCNYSVDTFLYFHPQRLTDKNYMLHKYLHRELNEWVVAVFDPFYNHNIKNAKSQLLVIWILGESKFIPLEIFEIRFWWNESNESKTSEKDSQLEKTAALENFWANTRRHSL